MTSKSLSHWTLESQDRLFSSGEMIFVYPFLIRAVGVNKGTILSLLHHLIDKEDNNNIFEGRKWVTCTYRQWKEQLPFFGKRTIQGSFLEMEKMGIVLSRMKGRMKYYSIDYEALDRLSIVEDRV